MKQVTTTAVILAGGLGTRLREVVPDLPKPLAPVNGRPFIFYLLHQLREGGIRKVIISTGYMAEAFEKHLGCDFQGMRLEYIREYEQLGTGGAIANLLDHVDSDSMMILNGDSYISFDVAAFVEMQREDGGVMLITPVKDISRYGAVIFDRNDRKITAFLEKRNQGSGFINAGIYLFRKSFLKKYLPSGKSSLEKDLFPKLAASGLLTAQECENPLLDIGTPESYLAASDFLAAYF